MNLKQVTYYDYEHCRTFLEERAKSLRESAKGLDVFALFRELYYSFSYEALENGELTLGQFDSCIVFLFIPVNASHLPGSGLHVARAKALELLNCTPSEPPVVLELLSSQSLPEPVGERGRMDRWMRPEFLNDIVLSQQVQIHLYFDGGSFIREVVEPQLTARGFTLADSYVQSAKSGELRVRHPAVPGKVFRIPWVSWLREMMGGGYSIVFLMACLTNYLQKLEAAVASKP